MPRRCVHEGGGHHGQPLGPFFPFFILMLLIGAAVETILRHMPKAITNVTARHRAPRRRAVSSGTVGAARVIIIIMLRSVRGPFARSAASVRAAPA